MVGKMKSENNAAISKNARQKSQIKPLKPEEFSDNESAKTNKGSRKSKSEYFRIIVKPKNEFNSFRYQDVGQPGHIQRLAGRRHDGSWDTQAWLIGKEDAHVEDNRLIPDSKEAKDLIKQLQADLKHIKANTFEAVSYRDMPQYARSTQKHQTARLDNIRDAYTKRIQKGS